MIERIVILLVVIAAAVLLWQFYHRWSLGRLQQSAPRDPLLTGVRHGTPVIVYFTAPFCAPCRTIQKPTIEHLQQELGDALQVIQIDASQDEETAARWGIFSLPTTVVLDQHHQVRHINRGVATREKLHLQLAGGD
ncbi:MAG: thioredoxin family protein [Anaerolineae bacterium]|nr:thioredoxin family protein [Anaerolineae bacterium]